MIPSSLSSDDVRRTWRLRRGYPPMQATRLLVPEAPLTIDVEAAGRYTIMRTPGADDALVAGLLLAEGFVRRAADITAIDTVSHAPDRMRVSLEPEAHGGAREAGRALVATEGGLCGHESIDDLLRELSPVGEALRVPGEALFGLGDRVQRQQTLLHATGTAHAAALLDDAGALHEVAEDVDRRNAVDKSIGRAFLAGRLAPRGSARAGLLLSGRMGLEMVVRASRAGLELIAAVGPPSAVAVDAAEQLGITLCGFVRGDDATVYTHPFRIEDAAARVERPGRTRSRRIARPRESGSPGGAPAGGTESTGELWIG